MRRGYLVYDSAMGEQRVLIDNALLIGRTPDCDLVVDDVAASRHHAKITVRKGRFLWRDLASTNGTTLNGAFMLEGELQSGDVLGIGDTQLRFLLEEIAESPAAVPEVAVFEETAIGRNVPAEVAPKVRAAKADDLLQAVYAVMNAVASIYDPCVLVDRVLETAMKAIKAKRAAVFCAGDSSEKLLPCSVCGHVHVIQDGKLQKANIDNIQISGTVARRVLEGGESVLYQDTSSEDELHAAASVMSLKLRSIMCVPLRAKSGIIGILYVDTDSAGHQYTQEDLQLTTAVGNSAGIAIENANMHRQMLEKQRIEQEIEYAWTIQEGFLVKEWPDADRRFEVYGITKPAKTVGGDFYDFVQPDADHVGLLIGDVSGKGVPAALAMAQMLAQFRLLCAQNTLSPTQMLKALNAELETRSKRGMFCTLCYVTIDLRTGELFCGNAGHHPAVHVAADGARSFGEASGPPAGVAADSTWTDECYRVKPGDSLLLYTDGIVEARTSPGREEYGVGRLLANAGRLYGRSPRMLIDALNEDVAKHCEPDPPHDDCTMIAVRYLGNS